MFKPNKDGYYNDGWIATETPAFSSEYYLIVVSGSSECAIFSDVGFNGDLASQVKSKLGEISGHSERVIAFMTTD